MNEEQMLEALRALGVSDDMRKALVKVATIGWTPEQIDLLTQLAAAGAMMPPWSPGTNEQERAL